MILYYALGGALGHVTRALAVIHTLRIREKTLVLTSVDTSIIGGVSRKVQFVKPSAAVLHDNEKLTAFIQQLVDTHLPSEIIIDGFPLGMYGELNHITYSGIRTYVARMLNWDRYVKAAGSRFFIYNQTLILEPLHDNHRYLIDRISESQSFLELNDPPQTTPLPQITDLDKHWLVLHAGADEEVSDLITYARQIREIEGKQNPLLLVTPSAINKWTHHPVTHLRYYPAQLLLPHVEKIISACGFNTMRQARPFRSKHHFFPFARRFDDQYFRAAIHRSVSAPGNPNIEGDSEIYNVYSEDTYL